jgi:aminopeptidase N
MDQTKTTFLSDYSPPDFFIEKVNLHFTLDEASTKVRSCLSFFRNSAKQNQPSGLVLQGEQLELLAISLNGIALRADEYQLTETELIIPNVPNDFTLIIENKIKPNKNTALSGLYVSRGIFCTQCEAEGFRRITYFLDRPDVLASYKTTIVADKTKYPVLLSNGNKIAYEELKNNQHSITWEDPFKKPCYLFALVAGNLEFIQDEFVTQSHKKITLQIFFEQAQRDKCQHAMDALKKAMRWDEQHYGREYDLAIFMIVVIDDFNMGAMENKGLNIFNAQTVLANPQTATDSDYNHVTKVVGHEYFHNWTGNRITCRDWFQLSLKEGLTVFREQEFSASVGNPVIERIQTVKLLRDLQFPEDAGPLAHPVQPDSYIEINNFYTTTIYEKGAELIRMMKLLVGEHRFRKAMDLYFTRYDGQAITIDDFITVIEETSAYDLKQFRYWYKQAGTPQLDIRYHYDPEIKVFSFTVKQSCPPTPLQLQKNPFYIPLSIALFDSAGEAIPLQFAGEETKHDGETQRILIIDKPEQHFRFVNISMQVTPSVLRNFSAPVKLKIDYRDEDLAFLIRHDNDGFNRWDAALQLVSRIILRRSGAEDAQHRAITLLVNAYHELFKNVPQENGLLAELLNLPSESYFAEQMKIIDVESIHYERKKLRQCIAEFLRNPLLKIYKNYQNFPSYKLDETAQMQRKLKNVGLSYLMLLNHSEIQALCVTQYQTADNMTDSICALTELVNHNSPESPAFLNDFYKKWQDDPLVICKWFALQARAPHQKTLAKVKELIAHAAFDWKNPNKIRSLIGVFCAENQLQFHQISGEGYRFLTEQVLYLDKLNPQIAARLLRPLTRWKRFDETRRQLMHEQLEQIVKFPGLSVDVYEIASKSLA